MRRDESKRRDREKRARGKQEGRRRRKGSEQVESREEGREGLEGRSVGGVLEGSGLGPTSPKYLTWFVAYFALCVFTGKIET